LEARLPDLAVSLLLARARHSPDSWLCSGPLTVEELLELDERRLAIAPSPSLITRAWVRERLKIWGPKHPKYLARVLGEFPSDDPASVFPLAWIERARREATD
jgi:hypothetical protein